MIKEHLANLTDFNLIIFLIAVIVLCRIFTLFISDKVNDFAAQKKKFYLYILSFVLFYTLLQFLVHKIKFEDVSNELLFYQIISLLAGIIHTCAYRFYFKKLNTEMIIVEILFACITALYSSILFSIIYIILNGLNFSILVITHFFLFIVPTNGYITFCLMMLIPSKQIATWSPEKSYKIIDHNEMKNILLITLLIKKRNNEDEYTTIRAQTPAKVDFGRLFFLAITGYNKQNADNPIQEQMSNRQDCKWIFYMQPKWYAPIKYVNALQDAKSNGITENSVIICERAEERNIIPEKKKKADTKKYHADSPKNDSKSTQPEQKKIDELKEPEEKGPVK